MSSAAADRSPSSPIPLRSPEPAIAVPVSLPRPLTSFVGRERELAAIRDLLQGETVRLVTLSGPGGVGKTRLALRVAESIEDRFADGALFVSLAPVRDPDLVAAAFAAALGVRDMREQPLAATLRASLADRELLLVLDNCEHLLDASPLVAGLLASCPGLTVLATSRSGLGISGERNVPVPPLALPDESAPPSLPPRSPVASLAANESVRLFVERAQAARPDFALTEANAAAVAAICRRLDGLPLAIELAAARVVVLPPAALLARLDPALPLLTGGPRDQPARLRTMRDAIAWSYGLLTPQQQLLFRRLSVFVGGFTLEAAEAVSGEIDRGPAFDSLTPRSSVLDDVTSLVAQNLLRPVHRQDDGPEADEPRFTMLETVREFGLTLLEANGEAVETHRRHAAFFLALGRNLAAQLAGPEMAIALDRLAVELPNVRAALAWTLAHDETETALRLAASLYAFWNYRGHLAEGRRWLEQTLARGGIPARARTDGLLAAAGLAALQGDHTHVATLVEVAQTLAEAEGYRFGVLRARHILAVSTEWQGEIATAAGIYEALLAEADAFGPPHWRVLLHSQLAETAHLRGDPARAAALAAEGLALGREVGHAWNTTLCLGVLANLAADRADHAEACRLYATSLEYSSALGDVRGVAGTLGGLAGIALARGQAERAARLLGAARALGDSIGVAHLGHAHYFARVVAATRASLGETPFSTAWAAGSALPLAEALAEATAIAAEASGVAPPPPDWARPAAETGLTGREVEVLRLLVRRLTDKEIADDLSISPRTVMNHVASILGKLGVASRREAADWGARHGFA
jgi:non-specific serine/threonine protein kinase